MPPTTGSRRSGGASSSSVDSATSTAARKTSMTSTGVLARALPARLESRLRLDADHASIVTSRSSAIRSASAREASPFGNAGVMRICAGSRAPAVWTADVTPTYVGARQTLARHPRARRRRSGAVLRQRRRPRAMGVPEGREEPDADQPLDGARVHLRRGRDPVPRPTDGPSRTILTGEGGATPSRFKHLIQTSDGRYRRLTPRELERLNGFPGDWTAGHVGREASFHDGQCPRGRPRRASRRRADRRRSPCRRSPRHAPPSLLAPPMAGTPAPEPAAERVRPSATSCGRTGPQHRPGASARRALREAGLGGYRLNWKKAPGRPDIAYPGRQGRDLRPRLLLAPLPALLPEPAEVEPGVLGAKVRAQPRARRPQASATSKQRLDSHRGLGVRPSGPTRRRSPSRSRRCSVGLDIELLDPEHRIERVAVEAVLFRHGSASLHIESRTASNRSGRGRQPRSAAEGQFPCTAADA